MPKKHRTVGSVPEAPRAGAWNGERRGADPCRSVRSVKSAFPLALVFSDLSRKGQDQVLDAD